MRADQLQPTGECDSTTIGAVSCEVVGGAEVGVGESPHTQPAAQHPAAQGGRRAGQPVDEQCVAVPGAR